MLVENRIKLAHIKAHLSQVHMFSYATDDFSQENEFFSNENPHSIQSNPKRYQFDAILSHCRRQEMRKNGKISTFFGSCRRATVLTMLKFTRERNGCSQLDSVIRISCFDGVVRCGSTTISEKMWMEVTAHWAPSIESGWNCCVYDWNDLCTVDERRNDRNGLLAVPISSALIARRRVYHYRSDKVSPAREGMEQYKMPANFFR